MKFKYRFALRLGPVLVGAAGAGLYSLSRAQVVHLDDQVTIGCVAAVALAAIVGPFLPDLMEATRLRREQEMSIALRKSIAWVIEQCGADWRSVGARLFLVGRSPRMLFRQVLIARSYERLNKFAFPAAIKRRKGTGLEGMCWESGDDIVLDVSAHFGAQGQLTQEVWQRLPRDVTFGLDWRAYEAMRRLDVIAAYAIKSRSGSIVGVVTVEGPGGSLNCLTNDIIRSYIGNVGDALVLALRR